MHELIKMEAIIFMDDKIPSQKKEGHIDEIEVAICLLCSPFYRIKKSSDKTSVCKHLRTIHPICFNDYLLYVLYFYLLYYVF